MNSISANLNIMIKACEKASKILIRDFGEIEKLQVSKKGPADFVTNSDLKSEKIIISGDVSVFRDGNILNGNELTIDLMTSISIIKGSNKKQVSAKVIE